MDPRRGMTQLAIPEGPEALTAKRLTEALSNHKSFSDAVLKDFTISRFAEGVGVLGQLVRVMMLDRSISAILDVNAADMLPLFD